MTNSLTLPAASGKADCEYFSESFTPPLPAKSPGKSTPSNKKKRLHCAHCLSCLSALDRPLRSMRRQPELVVPMHTKPFLRCLVCAIRPLTSGNPSCCLSANTCFTTAGRDMVYRLKLDAELNCLSTAEKGAVGRAETAQACQCSHTLNSKMWVSMNFH